MKQSQVRLVIADDHPIFRNGLRRLLEAEPYHTVLGEAADGLEAVKLARELKPDILLLDLAMPKHPGIEALRALSVPAKAAPVRVILLTSAAKKSQIVEALQLGARGVVLKDSATALLFKAIQSVMAGEYWVGRESVPNLVEYLRSLRPAHSESREKDFGLTAHELEIISAVVAGFSNRQIADYCKIGEDRVKHHLATIFHKLGVSTRLELAHFAVNHGLPIKSIEGAPPLPPADSSHMSAPTEKEQGGDYDDRDDHPLAGNLPALVLSIIMLSIFAAAAYGGLQLLRFLLNGACKVLHCG